MKNKTTIFVAAIIAAVLCLAISVYYIMPGYYHLLVTHDYTQGHPTHAFAFFALAVICVVVALVTRPKSASQAEQAEKAQQEA